METRTEECDFIYLQNYLGLKDENGVFAEASELGPTDLFFGDWGCPHIPLKVG